MKSVFLFVLAVGVALGSYAKEPQPSERPAEAASVGDALPDSATIDMGLPAVEDRSTDGLGPLRISLRHEASYKFETPKRLVNNRSSVQLEYSKRFGEQYLFRLDTKLNSYWNNDHRAKAEGESPLLESSTREAYVQGSFGKTSVRLGYQVLIWGISEGGAITDEVSPRNAAEVFFVPLEEARISQFMLTVDQFSPIGEWSLFAVPRPAYNKYPRAGTEYDIAGVFGSARKPQQDWNSKNFEYGLRWKRTFGRSDIGLMAASLIDNDYLVRKQRFKMYGLTANIPSGNVLYRTEIGLKRPKAFFAQASPGGAMSIAESDQLDASFGFDFSPGGRPLTFSAEVIRSRLLDWNESIVGRTKNTDTFVGSISNKFLNGDLTLTWMTIFSKPYRTYLHKFLGSYLIDDHNTVYVELFYPDVRDERSGSWPYRDQKQIVARYQYQF